MLICLDCGALFEQARSIIERHDLETPPYEEQLVCPRCSGSNLHQTYRCDVCGEWITGGYALTVDGCRICEECYSSRDIGHD